MFSLGDFESKLNDALERNAILESELDEKDELAETVQRLRDEARDLKQELAVRQQKASNISSTHKESISIMQQANLQATPSSQTTIAMETDSALIHQTPSSLDSSSNSIASGAPQTPNMLNTILNELNLKQQQQQQQQQQQNLSFGTPNFKQLNGGSANLTQSTTTSSSSNPSHHIFANGYATCNGQQQQQLPVTPSIRISALNYVGDALRKVTSMESRLVSQRNLIKDRRSATFSSNDASSFNNLLVVPIHNGNGSHHQHQHQQQQHNHLLHLMNSNGTITNVNNLLPANNLVPSSNSGSLTTNGTAKLIVAPVDVY
jgi:hypothetical protein